MIASAPEAVLTEEDAVAQYQAEVKRHYRWNVRAHLLYGLLGTTGWRLITAPTFVPDYLFRLGGSNLVVGAILFAGGLARFISPLVGASRVAHEPLVKRTAIRIGTGMRVQVLGMALAALVLPTRFNLVVFAFFYCGFNVLNGLQGVVFGLLMAKVIPLGRRGRFIGARDFAGGATAAAVAWIAASWLEHVAFPASHGLTYLLAFVFTSLGLVCFAAIREPRAPIVPEQRSVAATIGSARRLIASDPTFAWYCAARGLGNLGLMAAPFLIIAAASDAGGTRALGHATVAFFAAGTIANLLWGLLADRSGFRAVFLIGALTWIVALGWAGSMQPASSVVGLFLLVGAAQSGLQMASVNLVYEFSERGELGVRIAVVSAVGELCGAIAPLAGGIIADRWSYPALYGTAAFFTMLAVGTMFLGVHPRHQQEATRP
ncbi:MAG: MFS transporter [Candidatus Binatia bacterium]